MCYDPTLVLLSSEADNPRRYYPQQTTGKDLDARIIRLMDELENFGRESEMEQDRR